MGNVASLEVKAESNPRGILRSRRIQGLDLKKKFFFFLSGMIVSIPFVFYTKTMFNRLILTMPMPHARLISAAIFTPFLEELAKAYPLMYRQNETEKSIFHQGVIVGFGFGVVEALIYVFMLGAPITIRLPGILFHTLTAPITAYGIAKNRPILPYLLAVTLHFLNNLSAFFDLRWLITGYPILVTTFALAWYLYGRSCDSKADQ
jgi:RsiW-degrading membrane proteinase PrsW (M82 family)